MSTLPSNNQTEGLSSRGKVQPNLVAQAHANTFSRDLLSASLPKLPARVMPGATGNRDRVKSAASRDRSTSPTFNIVSGQPIGHSNSSFPSATNSRVGANNKSNDRITTAWGPNSPGSASPKSLPNVANLDSVESVKRALARNASPQLPLDLPGETTIGVGLMRIADHLSRAVLPWQAVLCPRAVETLHDVRSTMIQARHNAFIAQMRAKLEEKVLGFISRKEEEVDIWMEREIRSWQNFMQTGETDLTDFVRRDLARITDRAIAQDEAYRSRELRIASAIDDHERDSTREQLVNFRRIVRADNSRGGVPGAGKYESIEVRALQDSIAKAQSVTHKQTAKANRDITK